MEEKKSKDRKGTKKGVSPRMGSDLFMDTDQNIIFTLIYISFNVRTISDEGKREKEIERKELVDSANRQKSVHFASV